MQFVRAIAGTVTVFHQGRVLIEDDIDRVLAGPGVRDVYLGREVERRAGGAAVIEVSGLEAGYGRIRVLNGVTLAVAPGSCVGILGHNGMGKTTLLRTIDRAAAGHGGPDRPGRRRRDAAADPRPRAARHRLRAAGTADLPGAVGAREPALRGGGIGRPERPRSRRCSTSSRSWGGSLDRPGGALSGGEQQIAGAGPRALHRAPAAPARRADRGHPALDRRRRSRSGSTGLRRAAG